MKRKPRAWLAVERLEDRWIPSNNQLIGSTLFISPSAGEAALNLLVQQSPTVQNQFTVTDNGQFVGTYGPPVSNIYITGGNGADTITVDLNGNAYTGSLLVSSGNGNDTVTVTNSSTTPASFVGGNITILGTNGNKTVDLSAANALTIGGTVQITDLIGSNSVTVGNASGATRIGGDLDILGYPIVTLGVGSADTVGGNLNVTGGQSGGLNTLTFGDNFTVLKTTNFTAPTAGTESVTFNNNTFVGNATFNLSTAGSDTLALAQANGVSANAKTAIFDGNFTINGGAGNDSILLGGPQDGPLNNGAGGFPLTSQLQVNGTFRTTLGSGNDTITNGFNALHAGSTYYMLGNGNDLITDNSQVAGSKNFYLGNGMDTTTIGGDPPGGVINYTSGNGNDSVQLGDFDTGVHPVAHLWNVNMKFGTGSDTLTMTDTVGALSNTLTGKVDLGGPAGANFFNLGFKWTISSFFQLLNP